MAGMILNRRTFLSASLAATVTSALGKSALSDEPVAVPQQQLARDPLRPQFHLLPRRNWMNDPCAPRFHGGEYHMFFQYNPHAAVWGDMHWNHATSPDLVHWKHMPLALAPTRDSYDAYGCFTGSVLPGAAEPTILYTGVTKCAPEQETIRGEGTREVQCLATSSEPDLRSWQKLDKPVIAAPPPGVKVTGFRDPCPWKEGDTWYLIVGSGFDKVGGAVLLYTSKDARSWTYLHPLAQGVWNGGSQTNPVDTGEMWECPDFFPLGEKHVLLYSTERKVYWEVGSFDRKELRFRSETKGLLDHGAYYAMKSMLDAKGRRVLWGWVEETRTADACVQAGWAGCMALPRLLTLGADNRLRMQVPPEFTGLRRGVQSLAHGQHGPIEGRAAEAVFTFETGKTPCGLELRPRGGGASLVSLAYNGVASKPELKVASRGAQGGDEIQLLPLIPGPDGVVTVRLWMDGSVLELLVDGREAVTLRNYVAGDVECAATGAADALRTFELYGVAPISADRLTT
jgi:beta-fructofuranosidase